MVALSTDMSVPKDVTALRVKIKVGSEVRYEYDFFIAPDGEFHLPGTVAVVEGSKPAEVVQVEVVGIRNSKRTPEARVFAKITTTVPRERIALLRVPIQWLCDETAVDDGSQEYLSSCAPEGGEETSCVAGTCTSTNVDERALPSYTPAQVYGGGSSPSDPVARCFDVTSCFSHSEEVAPDADCTLSLADDGKPLNFALVPASADGICDARDPLSPCYVVLDNMERWGWTLQSAPPPPSGQRIVQFPPGVCQALKNGRASALRRALECESKTPIFPSCGPWSEIQPATPNTGGGGGAGGNAGAEQVGAEPGGASSRGGASGRGGTSGRGGASSGGTVGSGGTIEGNAGSIGAAATSNGGSASGGMPQGGASTGLAGTGGKSSAGGGASGAAASGMAGNGGSGGAAQGAEAISLPFDGTRVLSTARSPAL